jgi:diacylglycerol kinase (ATP)
MIRAGVIRNKASHRNRRGGQSALPDHVLAFVPESPDDLALGLREFAQRGVNLVVIDGGDGTIREVLTRLPEAFGDPLPRLAIVPSGKTNALALDIGTPLGTSLEALMAAGMAEGVTKTRTCLEVVREGHAHPESRGFLLGMAAFVRATELAQTHHGLGLFDNAAIAVTLAGATVQTVSGFGGWRDGETAELSLAGGEPARWFLVMASTLKRLPLGLRPFGEPRIGLKVLTVAAPPRRLIRAVPRILTGGDAPWLRSAGYERHDVDAFSAVFEGDFVLDGEIFRGGRLTVREGPRLEFVTP